MALADVWLLRLHTIGALVSGAWLLAIAGWAWRHQTTPGARPFVGVALTAAGWSITTGLFGLLPAPGWQRWLWLGKLSVVYTFPVAWVIFTLDLTHRHDRITSHLQYLLTGSTLLLVGITLTNPWHGLVLHYTTHVTAVGELLQIEMHLLGHFIVVYCFAVVVLANAVLLWDALSTPPPQRYQAIMVLSGLGMAMGIHIVTEQFDWIPEPIAVDLTPYGLLVFGIACTAATYWFRLFDVTPIARKRVLDRLSDMVLVFDRNHRLTDMNPAATQLPAVSPETLGDPATTILPTAVSELLPQRDAQTLARSPPDTRTAELTLDLDGDERTFRVEVEPLIVGTGETAQYAGTVVLFHDITELKAQQQALETKNQRLEQFASLVSHDLRNPLDTAQGYTDIARETGDHEALTQVEDSLDRMETLIDDMLVLAREGTSGLMQNPEPVRVTDVAEAAWTFVETYDATLACHDSVEVTADPDRLQQLFENLFRNAIEHAGEDVTVDVGGLANQSGFYVADDGPGIPREERDEIFEQGISGSASGTGLGLYIVQEIVDAHGWEIAVTESATGGARFEIRTS